MTLFDLPLQAVRRWNHRRLSARLARRVQKQGLSSYQTFGIQSWDEASLASWQSILAELKLFKLAAVTDNGKFSGHARQVCNVWRLTDCPHQSSKEGCYGIALTAGWQACAQRPQAQAALQGARFIWANRMSDVRGIIALGVPSSKVFLLPQDDEALQVPGAVLFTSREAVQRFFVGRFLLAFQAIDYDHFHEQCASCLKPLPDTVCLGVVEYVSRLDSFLSEQTGIAYFPGLRHTVGWLGCGLSYKFLASLAVRDEQTCLAICEDDVLLPADWRASWPRLLASVKQRLDTGRASLFAGVVTRLPEKFDVLDAEDWEDRKLVTLDQSTGTVFNIYGVTALRWLSQWRHDNCDGINNTIDKYLTHQPDLKVATLVPPIHGHKEDLQSTLWGQGMAIYGEMFEQTQARIRAVLERRHENICDD